MRPSLPRLLRIVPRSAVTPQAARKRVKIYEEIPKELRVQPTLLQVLQKRRDEAGADYPPNIRIEPVVSKQTFSGVKPDAREPLRNVLRER
ncbi:hypothetical protein EVG20_g2478 [Dentipellis fragilis]|uniref:Uncharacterized protein n=1 Tax=Dentipellis fragilis TaxID=205917 RepID=A0A4Y9Z9Q7_9AGAM|nr:hypothetical protein EVG20_g2478 [Dentipellis fragilis]